MPVATRTATEASASRLKRGTTWRTSPLRSSAATADQAGPPSTTRAARPPTQTDTAIRWRATDGTLSRGWASVAAWPMLATDRASPAAAPAMTDSHVCGRTPKRPSLRVSPATGSPTTSVKPSPASQERPKPVRSTSPSTLGLADRSRPRPEIEAAWNTSVASQATNRRRQAQGRARLNRPRKRSAAAESARPAARTAGVHTKRRTTTRPITASRAVYQVNRTAP